MKPSPVPSPAWAAGFVDRHPAFAIHRLLPVDTWIDWPTPAALTALLAARGVRNAAGRPVQIDIAVQESGAAGYERRILEAGRLAVRPGWHDLFNGLAWALFPHAKAALNARHVADLAEHGASQRSRVRDALTAFDEDGVILATSDAVLADHVRRFRWKDLFWHERQRLPGAFDVFVFGHGLAEKLLNPFVGLTAKAVIVDVEPAFFSRPL
ncbi:MAG: DUF3025 domain-containing protein, partial [Burkholderiales bacterium]|nr:DUF3025 domain-containing protein [Burkholderiales bacterium]